MNATPEQTHAAIARLMMKSATQELALAAIASLLTQKQIHQLRDRMAALSAMQEVADGGRSTATAQDLLQPAVDRLHGMMESAHRKFQGPA
jgi:uncharacterized coiled-coil protein SlyX